MDVLAQLVASPFFVGAAGALVSLRYAAGDTSWWQRGITMLCGGLVAGYCAQPLADWLKLSKHSDVLGVSFVLGLLGLSIIAAVLRAIGEMKVAEIVSGWISRKG